MAYITLDELKEILPDIFNQWEENDENWEWIFQEIEKKCHIGKPGKGKKKKKFDKEEYIRRNRVDIDALIQKFQDLNREVEEMHRKHIDESNSMSREIARIHSDIRSVKSMAQTAKQRTEVDYTKPEITYRQWEVCRKIIKTCERNGATKEELEQLDLIMSKYIPQDEKKECDRDKYYPFFQGSHMKQEDNNG